MQQPQVAHLELALHLLLELLELDDVAACDDKVIDVDSHDQLVRTLATSVHCMFGGAALESERHQGGVQLGVPCARGLT